MFAILAAVLLAVAPAPVLIDGPITTSSLDAAAKSVRDAGEGDTLKWRINSPGGSAFAMLNFIADAKAEKARKHLRIECHVDWLAASAAAVIFESGLCDLRTASRASVFLFHGASGGAGGKAGDIEDGAKLSRTLDRAAAELVAPRLHMTVDQYLAWIEQRDRFLSYDELAAIGGLDVHVAESAVKPAPVLAHPEPATAPAVQPKTISRASALVRMGFAKLLDLVHRSWAAAAPLLPQVAIAAGGVLLGWALSHAPSSRRLQALPHRRRAAKGAGRRSRR